MWVLWRRPALSLVKHIDQSKSLWFRFNRKPRLLIKKRIYPSNIMEASSKYVFDSDVFLSSSWWFQPLSRILVESKWVHLPQIGVKIRNIRNHHPVMCFLGFCFVMFKLSDKLKSGSFQAAVSYQKTQYKLHPSSNQPVPFLLYPSLSPWSLVNTDGPKKSNHP